MKKVLFFAAALAVVALGNTSCKGNDPSNEPFAIEVSNITYETADVAITAADSTVLFYFDLMPTEEYKATSQDTIAAQLFAAFDEAIAFYGEWGFDLHYIDFLSAGKAEYTFEDLDDNTDYTVFVGAVDTINKKITGKVVTKNFTTVKHELTSNLVLTFEKNVGILTITPSNNSETYAFQFLTDDEIDYGYDMMDWLNYYASYGIDEEFVAKGEQDIDLFDYLYAGSYTAQAAAVKATVVQDGEETYNEYERLSEISSFEFNYTVEDGAEEYTEEAPARAKKAVAKTQVNKPVIRKPLIK